MPVDMRYGSPYLERPNPQLVERTRRYFPGPKKYAPGIPVSGIKPKPEPEKYTKPTTRRAKPRRDASVGRDRPTKSVKNPSAKSRGNRKSRKKRKTRKGKKYNKKY